MSPWWLLASISVAGAHCSRRPSAARAAFVASPPIIVGPRHRRGPSGMHHRRRPQRDADAPWHTLAKIEDGNDDAFAQQLGRPCNRNDRRTTHLRAQPSDTSEDDESSSSSSLGEILTLVFPLLLVYISNQWSRYSISYLVDFSPPAAAATSGNAVSAFNAMNVDLQFTESQYGLLASTAFTILFALSSLIAGNAADRYNRKLLTLGSCAVWTLATLYTSQATSYEEVLAARVVMGGACAFSAPAAYTLIADAVPKDKLALSNSIYGSGVYLGGALASLSILLDERVGWRGAMGAIGVYGAVSAAAAGVLLPSDGDRDATQLKSGTEETEGEEKGIVQNTLEILSIPRVRFLFLGSFVRFCSGLLIGVWAPAYYKEAFPGNVDEYAVANALIKGGMGLTSGILGGYIADGLASWIKEPKDGMDSGLRSTARVYFDEQTIRLLLPIVGSLLAIPAWYQTTHSTGADNAFQLAMLWLLLEYLVAECWFGPTIAVLQSTVGATKMGTAQGMFVLTGALGNLAPTWLGWSYGNHIADQTASSSEVLANLLSWGVCAGYLLSSVFFVVSTQAGGPSLEAAKKEIN